MVRPVPGRTYYGKGRETEEGSLEAVLSTWRNDIFANVESQAQPCLSGSGQLFEIYNEEVC
jgi:hypothetical protein